jgi:predicted nucleotidyltransferase
VEELGLTGSSQARVDATQAADAARELTEQEKRDNVVRLAFGGSPERFAEFIRAIEEAIPPDTGVVLRGSAVTGRRWKDGAMFDAEGPGTSDLDLTLVGEEVIGLFKVTGFFVPGVHSRPVSDADPDIAPALVPLRQRLMALVHRPVNIQATRDFVMYLRGEVIGQPYLVLVHKTGDSEASETA